MTHYWKTAVRWQLTCSFCCRGCAKMPASVLTLSCVHLWGCSWESLDGVLACMLTSAWLEAGLSLMKVRPKSDAGYAVPPSCRVAPHLTRVPCAPLFSVRDFRSCLRFWGYPMGFMQTPVGLFLSSAWWYLHLVPERKIRARDQSIPSFLPGTGASWGDTVECEARQGGFAGHREAARKVAENLLAFCRPGRP